MSDLARLQLAFQARVLAGSTNIDAAIASRDHGELGTRLGIYEHAYVSRLVEGLGATYRALRRQLGDEQFAAVTTAFIRAAPSKHASIRDYGAELGAFLRSVRPGVEGQALAELAEWEWMLADVFDAADAASVDTARLGRLPPAQWPHARLLVHPTVRRMRTRTNAVDLWRIATGAAEAHTEPEVRPDTEWVAWRRDLTTQFRSVSSDEAAALDAMRAGGTVAGICECLAAQVAPDDAAARAAGLLRRWICDGMITDLSVPDCVDDSSAQRDLLRGGQQQRDRPRP